MGNHNALTDSFWNEKVEWKKNGDLTEDGNITVRVEGEHYVFHPETTSNIIGHSGREFTAEFISGPHAGKTIKCSNVWNQGVIPDAYTKTLPDNAVFHWDTTPLIV